MNVIKQILVFITLSIGAISGFSQKIENVYFEQVENKIFIYYDLLTENQKLKFNVSINSSDNGGETWDVTIISISGDVGKNQKAGTHKKIVWDVLKDYKKKSGPIKFKVQANYYDKTNYLYDKRDGEKYDIIIIDNLLWMTENLNYEPNNSKLNNKSVDITYGKLYDWETAQSVCPDGWHLPSDSEWSLLENHLGMFYNELSDVGERGINKKGEIETYTYKMPIGKKIKNDPYNFIDFYYGYIDIDKNHKADNFIAIFWTSRTFLN